MPPVVLERPKMTRQMWDALKTHILKERKKIKQELEADAEVERQRKERERQVKQDSMTLSQTKHQLSSLDSRLTELKEEKHQLFLKLKKVLNEDETRRRQLLSKEAANAQHEQLMTMQNMGYMSSQGVPGGHYMQTGVGLPNRSNAGGPQIFNKVGPIPQHSTHNIIPPGSIKRSRSPSPPSIQHNYKFGPYKPPPEAIHSYPQKLQYYPPPTSQPPPQSFQPPQRQQQQQQQQHQQLQINQVQAPPRMESSLYSYTAPPTRSPQTNREEPPKHNIMPTYLHHNQQMHRGYVLHQQQGIEHPPPQKFEDGPKYYPPPSTHQLHRPPHISLHPGLSIQQHQSGPTSGSIGSITSGYPIRTVVSNFQGRPPSPHVIYTGSPRLSYNHPNHGQQQQQQVTVQRYSLPPHGHQRD